MVASGTATDVVIEPRYHTRTEHSGEIRSRAIAQETSVLNDSFGDWAGKSLRFGSVSFGTQLLLSVGF